MARQQRSQAWLMAKEKTARSIFTPSSPVRIDSLFSGRLDQLATLFDTLGSPGQHAVVFGEPGVGKTSLAQFFSRKMPFPNVYVTCSRDDSLDSLFRKCFRQIDIRVEKQGVGFASPAREITTSLLSIAGDARLSASMIIDLLDSATNSERMTVFFDEFDRMRINVRRQFAEIIKHISDQDVNCCLVLVGVAHDLTALLDEHGSVERSLRQIHMPRMSEDELAEVVRRGLDQLELDSSPSVRRRIASSSRGLPFYTHFLALNAVRNSLGRHIGALPGVDKLGAGLETSELRVSVMGRDVSRSIAYAASEKGIPSLANSRTVAIAGDKEVLYSRVLDAAASCAKDPTGQFSVADVRAEVSRRGEENSSAVNGAVEGLTYEARGPVLVGQGRRQRRRLRFKNPLLEVYLVLRQEVHSNKT